LDVKTLEVTDGADFNKIPHDNSFSSGRSEQKNKTVVQILRTFMEKQQSRWLQNLPSTQQ
jgi:hypothetical protein